MHDHRVVRVFPILTIDGDSALAADSITLAMMDQYAAICRRLTPLKDAVVLDNAPVRMYLVDQEENPDVIIVFDRSPLVMAPRLQGEFPTSIVVCPWYTEAHGALDEDSVGALNQFGVLVKADMLPYNILNWVRDVWEHEHGVRPI